MAKQDSSDAFAIIREEQTSAPNFDLDTEAILTELRRWKTLCAFRVVEAGGDRASIEFDTLPADMDAFVKDLYAFCPDLVDQGTGCVAEMIEMATETGEDIPANVQELIKGVDLDDENYGLEILKRELQRDKKVMLWWD
jgi:uncharacterized protein DUF4253